MKSLIITGGQIDLPFARQLMEKERWDFVISADSGLNFCREAEILPDEILGDFDSVNPGALQFFQDRCPERIHVYPPEKDETDTELAILRALEMGADSITILGGTGTRLDHVLGNLQLLKMAMEAGTECAIVDPHNRIRMIRERTEICREEQFGTYVSLIPFTPQVEGLTLRGFAYEVEEFTLESGKARGVSNEIREDVAVIEMRQGILLVIESRD
ncbi:MAG: thiamine diphosphokinase [Clostridiales bacterium]|nr:thiamine diphosphokinase [Clostridiales bacterium]